MEILYVVISNHFGNLPLGIFSSLDEAKIVVDSLTQRNNHGCIFTYSTGQLYFLNSSPHPQNVFDNGIN